MIRKALALIAARLATMDLTQGSDMLRQLLLSALQGLQEAAKVTPAIWDDLVIALAIRLVESALWESIVGEARTVQVSGGEVACDFSDDLVDRAGALGLA